MSTPEESIARYKQATATARQYAQKIRRRFFEAIDVGEYAVLKEDEDFCNMLDSLLDGIEETSGYLVKGAEEFATLGLQMRAEHLAKMDDLCAGLEAMNETCENLLHKLDEVEAASRRGITDKEGVQA